MNIYAYKNTSVGAKLLSQALDCLLIKHEGSSFKGNKNKLIINWGASEVPKEVRKCNILNHPDAVETVVNRRNMLRNLSTQFNVPPFTSDEEEAKAWAQNGVVHEKDGVYTLDVKETTVFRIHQFPGKCAYVQFKAGEVSNIPEATRTLIKETCDEVRAFLGLDFCAITVGWNEKTHQYYILNVNTAPELSEQLARIYAENIKELV